MGTVRQWEYILAEKMVAHLIITVPLLPFCDFSSNWKIMKKFQSSYWVCTSPLMYDYFLKLYYTSSSVSKRKFLDRSKEDDSWRNKPWESNLTFSEEFAPWRIWRGVNFFPQEFNLPLVSSCITYEYIFTSTSSTRWNTISLKSLMVILLLVIDSMEFFTQILPPTDHSTAESTCCKLNNGRKLFYQMLKHIRNLCEMHMHVKKFSKPWTKNYKWFSSIGIKCHSFCMNSIGG